MFCPYFVRSGCTICVCAPRHAGHWRSANSSTRIEELALPVGGFVDSAERPSLLIQALRMRSPRRGSFFIGDRVHGKGKSEKAKGKRSRIKGKRVIHFCPSFAFCALPFAFLTLRFYPMSLYLKYRPKSFADVVGQEHIVTTLEHAVERNQLVHAYLFFGPRGTGKTSVARILAKILLIRDVKDENIQKQIIKSADEGSLVDLIEIDAATNRQIDDIRELKEKVQFTPVVASAKVYIIDEVHMMTKEAFNALLKTLEEPPPHAFFILATTELHKVPDTIQSRCQRFPFREIGEEDIVRALQNIADKERITADRGALRAIARHVNGGMRDAVSLLDQLSSLGEITEDDVRIRVGESAEEYVETIWAGIEAKDRMAILAVTATLQEKGVSLEVFLRQLLFRARTDLHARIAAKEDTSPALLRIDAIFRALRDIRLSPIPAVALEVALVELCLSGEESTERPSPAAKKSTEKPTILKKLTKQDSEAKTEGKGKEESVLTEAVQTTPATFVARELTLETLRDAWNSIVASVQPPSVRMSLKDGVIQGIADGRLTLAFASGFHREKVTNPSASREVERAIKEQFHQVVRLECVLQEDRVLAPKAAMASSESVNMAEAVAEIFG